MRCASSSMPNTAGTMTMPGAVMPGRANSSAPILRPSRMASSRFLPARFSCASILVLPNSAEARHAAGRRIFAMQLFARKDERPRGMRGECRFGEARQDELQLPRVSRNVADREDAWRAGGAAGGLDADVVALEIDAPF